jgi:hypothetical protein
VQAEIQHLEEEDRILSLTGALFRTLIDSEVSSNVKAVERLLSEGLQAVFDDMDLAVKAEVDIQRGKVSVSLLTVERHPDGTVTEGSSIDAYGGSVSAVESALLRMIVILRRKLLPVLLMDEPFGAVEGKYVPNVASFLSTLCKKVGMDSLTVTHNTVIIEGAHHAYRIQKSGGVAVLREDK